MYTEEFEDNSVSIKKLLIRIVIVLVLIIISIIVISFVTKDNYINKENISVNSYNSVYMDNINHIESVVLGDLTKKNLKNIESNTYKKTISDLINDSKLVNIIDSKDKICNSNDSYVEVVKYKNSDYLLKIRLKCSDKDDYVLKHLTHYNYCRNYLCDKEEIKISGKSSEVVKEQEFSSVKKHNTNIKQLPEELTNYIPQIKENTLYEYAKTSNAKYDKWSAWSGWMRTSCNTLSENCDDRSPLCRRKVVLYSQDEKTGTYNHKYSIKRRELKQTSTTVIKGCSNYNYVIINGVTYSTSSVYTTINNINNLTKTTQGSWNYDGEVVLDNIPVDTEIKRYKFVRMDFSNCGDVCENNKIKYVYDAYTYNGTLDNVSLNEKLLCSGSSKKNVAVYENSEIIDSSSRKEPVYEKACYYNMKTRKVSSKGTTETVYSDYEDQNLKENNFYYTGNTKEKN